MEDEFERLPIHELEWNRSRLDMDSGLPPDKKFSNPQPCSPIKANLVTSKMQSGYTMGNKHYLMLDCDYTVQQLQSNTKNHSHLVFQQPLTYDEMIEVLEVMAKVGLIQHGYLQSAKVMGYSAIRAPGIKKHYPEDSYGLNSDGEIESREDFQKAVYEHNR